MREGPFEELVQTLSVKMRERNYYPERIPEAGNFLIVVHWGETDIEGIFDEPFLNEPGDAGVDSSDVNMDGASGNSAPDS